VRREQLRAAIDRDPEAVVDLVLSLMARVEELERELRRNSRNSSLPPSRDSPAARGQRPGRKGSGRRQGGQPGHPGQHRELVCDPDRVLEHWPAACGGCGRPVGRQPVGEPVVHQVSEIEVRVLVSEHRRQRVSCPRCRTRTLAELPAGVPAGAFGATVAAAATTLTAARLSRRDTARLLQDLCGVKISPASVEGLVKQASDALEDPYAQILARLDASPVRCADETSWRQADRARWLSVAAAEHAALFQLTDRRDRDATMALLGEQPAGTIVSDRYAVYAYIDPAQRQLCLAHLLRDCTALGERKGAPGRLGRKLQRTLHDVFAVLDSADGDDLQTLSDQLAEHRRRLHELLGRGQRSRDPRTARFCAGLLSSWESLWTFTRVPGVPATNNAAERALRHAVLWRKTSYGTQTDHGDRLVERLLTIRESCRLQGRRLHDYLTNAIAAQLNGQPIPTPLPP
jgi:transposase